ncbi:crotonase/enoyl-CoA hydratase family protein [Pyruvatibacter mobilis]|jgi:enoyl-CoA hydratase/carnithine racemase|uniref:Crotonase/enoyl-CoA hydratase family protein n=1 Tax=Pyruvatibacter mobilis TaxID=1712261 RepID=A0A845Q9X5_9HYPH|nr:crotonase/enoyl-CoA hydratase family protein [Pyruvatibacter mobilis]NBG95435.1 crotonase/enoyl-CoA hydratase family protein [Pyruvatibacter mobilis]QJD75476.1 crotonase/enoyl-CoA hydratase family protein [Pyruvatibacter mobilis]GGD15936.1 enoyl-CoA hydratase [Pyruvatibacter mobilis]
MSDAPVLLEVDGHIATLTINRPDARNAIGEPEDGPAFAAAADQINADVNIRAVILTGAGKAFSAGGNIKAMKEKAGNFAGPGVDIARGYYTGIHRIVKSLWALEVPMIAAVNGPAIGLGNDVACLADTRIASDKAIFGATFLKIGLVPGDGGSWLLPRVIGSARAAELFFTGDVIDAETAREWGLVSRVVPHDDLMAEARALAEKMAKQPPHVLRMTKRLMRQGMTTTFDQIMDMSANMQALAHHTEDHAEAVSAFIEKRDPTYHGR